MTLFVAFQFSDAMAMTPTFGLSTVAYQGAGFLAGSAGFGAAVSRLLENFPILPYAASGFVFLLCGLGARLPLVLHVLQ